MKQSFRLLRKNWKPLLLFEIIYHLAVSVLFAPLYYAVFQLSIRASGQTYLSTESIREYLRHPVSILLVLFILFSIALSAICNICAILQCFSASERNERTTVTQMLFSSIFGLRLLGQKGNLLLLPLTALLIPLTCMATIAGYQVLRDIPSFVLDFIWHAPALTVAFILLVLTLLCLSIRFLFTIHIYATEEHSIISAAKKSFRLTRGRFFRTAWHILIWQGLLLAALFIVCLALCSFALMLVKLLAPPHWAYYFALLAVWMIIDICFSLFSYLAIALFFARIGTLYKEYSSGFSPVFPRRMPAVPTSPAVRRIAVAVLCLAFLANIAWHSYVEYAQGETTELFFSQPAVSAHRGDSLNAPENSIPAFESAIRIGADWIELDVHQTKDGVVVVSHDADLKRIAGVNKNIWELTYEEVSQYDVGSWFSPQFSSLRLATLDDVLKLCKGKVDLNIELKPTGHEKNFEQNVIDIVLANGFENNCVLASLNAECLRRVEQLNPNLTTVYNMAVAVGQFVDIPYIDGYSIEYSFVTDEIVRSIRAHNKLIFVWTINTPARVDSAIALGVDNIITDKPGMARAVIYGDQMSDVISEWIAWLFPPDDSILHDLELETTCDEI